ncbi:hypothetical protein PV325_000939, partial [Microctonus aethiopoides]
MNNDDDDDDKDNDASENEDGVEHLESDLVVGYLKREFNGNGKLEQNDIPDTIALQMLLFSIPVTRLQLDLLVSGIMYLIPNVHKP